MTHHGFGLTFYRKVYIFDVDVLPMTSNDWEHRGQVILPDYAYRNEIANALAVLGLRAPQSSDRISWSYATLPGERGPLPWPRLSIANSRGLSYVRLSAWDKNVRKLERGKV